MSTTRLTTSLRSLAPITVGHDDCHSDVNAYADRPVGHLEAELSWRQLSSYIQKCSRGKTAKIPLQRLLELAQKIVGENDQRVIEDAAVMLFTLLCQSSEEKVMPDETVKLHSIFGQLRPQLCAELKAVVFQIAVLLTADELEFISSSVHHQNMQEFGEAIKINFGNIECDTDAEFEWLNSEEDTSTSVMNMTNFAYEHLATHMDSHAVTKNLVAKSEVSDFFDGRQWLYTEINAHLSDGASHGTELSLDDIVNAVFEALTSARSDIHLQTELCDLLGFDQFDLIRSLLEHRSMIVSSYEKRNQSVLGAESSQFQSGIRKGDARPAVASQVVIQTQDEQNLRKLMRREEKKFMRKAGAPASDDASFSFDPQMLRAQRESLLQAASNAPLFSSRGTYPSAEIEQYPFVFDSYAAVKQTSSFIAGSKLCLPVDLVKVNNNVYEEISIPAKEKATQNVVGTKLVMIDSLDEVAQSVFRGTKKLNLIQSVVFEAAYKSNENLLICAPTGAGKTNIAMLTVLHEIKQHMSEGVLRKDEFKIVYVAPMKALAAEMVRNFGGRLSCLGLTVMELTGDMQLTKTEIMNTQMLVTTPEKWDVVTRKSTGDVSLSQIVRLLIIDEVHLLHDDRGAVIESIVARTLRQVESSQTMIRIVGLSATLPNYVDVARFLHVNPRKGLFVFDGRFRPVPLSQTFIGIKATGRVQQLQDFNNVCYEKVIHQLRNGHQVMVFVHARNETVRTATGLCEMAKNNGDISLFAPEDSPSFGNALKQIGHSRNRQLRELFPEGIAMHHAGMLRQDRNLVEKYFAEGLIRVIVCTATLAWGVNLPAHAVIIKGTQIYDAKKGSFVDLSILDVIQIFGRAGRPQYDTVGHGTIITSHDKLSHYLSILTQQNPIESQFVNGLTDSLNAEIALGTVGNVEEAVQWLSYTYLYIRMMHNPLVYGIPHTEFQNDPRLENWRKELIVNAGRALDKAHMIRFVESTGQFSSTDLGRTASHFYLKYDTIEVFNERFAQVMSEDKVLDMVSNAQEFEQIKVRDEEMVEIDKHLSESCHVSVTGGTENTHGKVNILIQSYISRAAVDSFSLVSDQAYVVQNATRIVRGLFEMALRKNWPLMAGRLLKLSKMLEKRFWDWEHPLRQFAHLSPEIISKIEERGLSIDRLREMSADEIGHMIHHVNMGSRVKSCVEQIPMLDVDVSVQPITRTILRVVLKISAQFSWNDRVHGKTAEPFWIWIEDPDNNHIYHSEYFMMRKKYVQLQQAQSLVFTIPIFEPLPSQYFVRIISDRWLGSDTTEPISFQHLILPEKHPPHTDLLDLQPLPITALGDPTLESLYSFTHFNPVQTQIFHPVYHSDCNVLLGAPTGSGKTVAAEMAIFRVFRIYPESKAVYIAPLKALVRERMDDWKIRIEQKLGKKVVELTGDVTPDMQAVAEADLIVTTPEKWDGISRSWQSRRYVTAVSLIVIDEIHLLGNDRGPVLEVIVSRTNFISSHTERTVRVVGLSTALANARDLADWLGIKQMGLFNFRPSVRPVPLEVHINGFPGKHYCPRMATMNKPAFQAIKVHSPEKPSLVFVSSRRQTRLTALDLIAYLAADDNPKQWLHMPESEMENIIANIKDNNLKLTLAFGIGMHHAGLHERDRKTVEELFVNQKIQILIATSTLAWGVNFPAHLVVIKGTEYYDGKTKQYVDFPVTDVLQMMGRAGRPQFDNQGVAVILVHDVKKHFYKKFLYEPFPVESNLLEVLSDHLNAEIVAGTINSKQDAMDYITWTYFFRRLIMNPSFYKLDDTSTDHINLYLSRLVQQAVHDLQLSSCVDVAEDEYALATTTLGRIASYYYVSHLTIRMFRSKLTSDCDVSEILAILSNAQEFSDLPVRHNEDVVNSELAKKLPLSADTHSYDSSHTKTFLLIQAHLERCQLPSTDYHTDTKSVLDQVLRVLQAMLDVVADAGWLVTTIRVINIIQMITQARWHTDSTLMTLPFIQSNNLVSLKSRLPAIESLPELIDYVRGRFENIEALLGRELSRAQLDQIFQAVEHLPQVEISAKIKGLKSDDSEQQSCPEKILSFNAEGFNKRRWITVACDSEYIMSIELKRLNRSRKHDGRAHAPHFPKPRDEGWVLVLGEVETRDVVVLKRIGCIRGSRLSTSMSFFTPVRPGRVIYTLYVLSDAYLGLDQQFDICLEVMEQSQISAVES